MEEARRQVSAAFYKGFGTSALDSKGRFVMPAGFRTELRKSCEVQTRMYIRVETDQPYLSVFGDAELEEFRRDSIELARIARERGEPFDRVAYDARKFGGVEDAKLDDGGRFAIDRDMRDFVGITDGIVVVGAVSLIQLWDPLRYLEVEKPGGLFEQRARKLIAEMDEKRKARAQ